MSTQDLWEVLRLALIEYDSPYCQDALAQLREQYGGECVWVRHDENPARPYHEVPHFGDTEMHLPMPDPIREGGWVCCPFCGKRIVEAEDA